MPIERDIDRFMARAAQKAGDHIEWVFGTINRHVEDMSYLAMAAIELRVERIAASHFGKLKLAVSFDLTAKDRIARMSAQSDIDKFVLAYMSKQALLGYVNGQRVDLDEGRKLDEEVFTNIEGQCEKVGDRSWVYATAALALFDELEKRKIDNDGGYRLEIHKMMVDGGNREIANKVAGTRDRHELINILEKCISE